MAQKTSQNSSPPPVNLLNLRLDEDLQFYVVVVVVVFYSKSLCDKFSYFNMFNIELNVV